MAVRTAIGLAIGSPSRIPDGKALFNADYRPPIDDVSEEYPIFLTTGRVISQFRSGTQTRRIGPLVDQYPEPRIEIHPRVADKFGINDGDWATWWVPMLIIPGVWRHIYRRFPLRYDPLYWGAVFPPGMYTACTYRLTHVMNPELLGWIPRIFIYTALAA